MGVSLYVVFNNKLRPTRYKLLALTAVFLVYLFVGAYLHMAINLPVELDERIELQNLINKFYEEHNCLDRKETENYIQILTQAVDNGISFGKNTSEILSSWLFGGETLFFAFTLIATIGYGHLSPLTDDGKIFCIFYIIIGVPITVLLLEILADNLMFSLGFNKNKKTNTSNDNKKFQTNLSSFIKFGLFLIIFIYVLPSVIFTEFTESKWSFVDSLYFCYISISTIGLGDLVPAKLYSNGARDVYRLIMTIYLTVGIITNVLFFNMFINLPILDKMCYLLVPKYKRAMYEAIEDTSSNDEDESNNSNRQFQSKIASDNDTNEIIDETIVKVTSRSTTPTSSRLKTKIV